MLLAQSLSALSYSVESGHRVRKITGDYSMAAVSDLAGVDGMRQACTSVVQSVDYSCLV